MQPLRNSATQRPYAVRAYTAGLLLDSRLNCFVVFVERLNLAKATLWPATLSLSERSCENGV